MQCSVSYAGFEVLTVVTMKNAVSWDVTIATRWNIPEDGILHSVSYSFTKRQKHLLDFICVVKSFDFLKVCFINWIITALQILCKIWGFHGCDYEDWHLFGYKNPVRTSQETIYLLRILCRIWGFHGADYEKCHLLGCYALWPTFQRNVGAY
jgi:hypothetical protein